MNGYIIPVLIVILIGWLVYQDAKLNAEFAEIIGVAVDDREGRRAYRDTQPSPYYMQSIPNPWPTVDNVPAAEQRDYFPYLYGRDPFIYDGPLPYDYDPYYDLRYPALHLRTVNPRPFISSEMWPEQINSTGFNPVTAQPASPTMPTWPPGAFSHLHRNGTPDMPISGFVTQPGSKVAEMMQWISPVPCSDPDYHGELPCDRSNCTVGGGGPQHS